MWSSGLHGFKLLENPGIRDIKFDIFTIQNSF